MKWPGISQLDRTRARLTARLRRRAQLGLHGHAPSDKCRERIDLLPDDELERLNDLLPWAAFITDGQGRRFGDAYSTSKRTEPQQIPDRRILELDTRVPLAGLHVLEVGCFEGIHTAALCERAGRVTALDSHVENVVKTMVRCGFLGHHPDVLRIDLEQPLPTSIDLHADVLHHMGVLYHLTDPVGHLTVMAGLTRRAILLDTHIAREDADPSLVRAYDVSGRTWRYQRFEESGRAAPFAGMLDHAKWLYRDDLLDLLRELGFADIDCDLRHERHGPRVTIYATR